MRESIFKKNNWMMFTNNNYTIIDRPRGHNGNQSMFHRIFIIKISRGQRVHNNQSSLRTKEIYKI